MTVPRCVKVAIRSSSKIKMIYFVMIHYVGVKSVLGAPILSKKKMLSIPNIKVRDRQMDNILS
jgi:hypothetical protein